MRVAEEVFGAGDHIGVLVRDRFPGYDNSFKGKQQYCFEHLKRDCKELLEWAVGTVPVWSPLAAKPNQAPGTVPM